MEFSTGKTKVPQTFLSSPVPRHHRQVQDCCNGTPTKVPGSGFSPSKSIQSEEPEHPQHSEIACPVQSNFCGAILSQVSSSRHEGLVAYGRESIAVVSNHQISKGQAQIFLDRFLFLQKAIIHYPLIKSLS